MNGAGLESNHDFVLSRRPVTGIKGHLEGDPRSQVQERRFPGMDRARFHSARMSGSPSTHGNLAAGGNAIGVAKPLAFSIDRIMARTPEPKATPFPSAFPAVSPADPKPVLHMNSSVHYVIPFVPLGYEPSQNESATGPQSDQFDASSYTSNEMNSNLSSPGPHASMEHYKLFRPKVVNQCSFQAMGAVCYLNCPCPPPAGIVNIHPMASYFLNPLHARQKAFLSERNRLGHHEDRRQTGIAFKDLSQTQLQHYAKEGAQIMSEKLFKNSSKLNSVTPNPNTKPKVFTCDLCGKVSSLLAKCSVSI